MEPRPLLSTETPDAGTRPMTPDEIRAANERFLAILERDDRARAERAADHFTAFVRDRMYRWYHIPNRYLIEPVDPTARELRRFRTTAALLAAELAAHGHIALDRDGEPACLSGREPVVPHTLEGTRRNRGARSLR